MPDNQSSFLNGITYEVTQQNNYSSFLISYQPIRYECALLSHNAHMNRETQRPHTVTALELVRHIQENY